MASAQNEYEVCVIGAGPAGLTAAYMLTKQPRSLIVLEADAKYVGGISRTEHHPPHRVDIGGHRFFSKSAEILALWQEILGEDFLKVKRQSRIYFGGKFYPYPLALGQTLRNLGLIESAHCMLSYLKARIVPVKPVRTFADWVSNRFGKRLFGMFFKTYTEKVWGMKCEEISADWAAQRIQGLSLWVAVMGALKHSLGFGAKGPKTLIHSFYYPRFGPGMMWEKAADKIKERGGILQMSATVTQLHYEAPTKTWNVTYRDSASGEERVVLAKNVISTMPLSALVHAVTHAIEAVKQAASKLRYRDFLIVCLTLKERVPLKDQWLYIHDEHVKVGRIQMFKNWSAAMAPLPGVTCYGMEYFCNQTDPFWQLSDEALIRTASEELVSLHLARKEDILDGFVVRQLKAYPVYDSDYQNHVTIIREWLMEHCPGLQVAGRNAMHMYNNQDHSMMAGWFCAENIACGTLRYDPWKINQDATYHEAGEHAASGLRLVPRPF